ncbi:unnamed protein product [Acanthoscelides obtectus]|uniref:Uncharacterized protein n=1 Tax=Acanthoscelides obtectus TaxID=200917 RepID=A0A9P0KWK6_ACAOB|nr:unnamed protein product [Acanthoscelides obtectus]CAH2016205.1 unnamed protein product [Acanthoscelides obtectus]CAK1641282.1 hypothetical protein AOBTE_LOCUS12300 [Acanthoscelides obtectus]CAK1643409.1 hypothetical protein AOBTE_LOCUS13522 [Acanthoscelides obtectus]
MWFDAKCRTSFECISG